MMSATAARRVSSHHYMPRPHTMLIVVPVDNEVPLGPAEGDTISLPSVAPVRFEPL